MIELGEQFQALTIKIQDLSLSGLYLTLSETKSRLGSKKKKEEEEDINGKYMGRSGKSIFVILDGV